MWYDPLLGALAYCIKFGFSAIAIVWGVKYLAEYIFSFLTEELEKHEQTR